VAKDGFYIYHIGYSVNDKIFDFIFTTLKR
jgi:hypothetical protein